jgi:hypothetical protein
MAETLNSEQLYTQFSPEERARLALAALARDDQNEDGRLRRTCPTKIYKSRDLEFVDRMETAGEIALIVQNDLSVHIAVLHTLLEIPEIMFPALKLFDNQSEAAFFMGMQSQLDKNANTREDGGEARAKIEADENDGLEDWVEEQQEDPSIVAALKMISDSSQDNHERLHRVLNTMMERPARKLVSRLAGLARFTQKFMGLDAMAFLDAFHMPVRYFLPSLRERFSSIKLDDAEVHEYASSLEQFWQKQVENPK